MKAALRFAFMLWTTLALFSPLLYEPWLVMGQELESPALRGLFSFVIKPTPAKKTLVPPWFSGPYATDLTVSPPQAPSPNHVLGTDPSGRDLLARLLYGTRTSILFGLFAGLGAAFLGLLFGWLGAISSGVFRALLLSFTESIGSLPTFLVALLFLSAFPNAITILFLIRILLPWTLVANNVRTEMLAAMTQESFQSAKAAGFTRLQIARFHLLPLSLSAVKSVFPTLMAFHILSLTSLDFYGVGLAAPLPSLGEAFRFAFEIPGAWWLVAFPTLILAVIIMGLQGIEMKSLWTRPPRPHKYRQWNFVTRLLRTGWASP